MQDQDIINEEERHEAATEEPTTLGISAEAEGRAAEQPLGQCPSLGPKVLPSGFDGTEPGISFGKGRLFKRKHISSCHGTYIYDYVCINDARIRASLHFDNGGLENHATLWVGEGERCFCYTTFNTSSAVKCHYLVRGMIAGLAKRLVYHHKNLINLKAKWAAAKGGGAK